MTVADWLAILARSAESAWTELLLRAEAVARRVDRSHSEELAAAIVATLFEQQGSPLHRAASSTALEGWLCGALRRLHRVEQRKRVRECPATTGSTTALERGVRPATRGAAPIRQRVALPRSGDVSLTDPQREAYELFRLGMSIASIADLLELDWHSVRDRLARALRRVRDGAPKGPPARAWALHEAGRPELQAGRRWVFQQYAAGESHRVIARALGLDRDAVRKRLSRARRAFERRARRRNHARDVRPPRPSSPPRRRHCG